MPRALILRTVAILALGATLSAPLAAQPDDAGAIAVKVRMIVARQPIAVKQSEAKASPHLDKDLADLSGQLGLLPYRCFKLLLTQQMLVPVKKKEFLRLRNGELLGMRLLYRTKDRVGLWLNWHDRAGAEILNTRLHFNSNAALVTGTDRSDDRATILAVSLGQ
jgi:hypothetical protein